MNANDLIPEDEETRLLYILEAEYGRTFREMHHLVRDALLTDPSIFRLDDAITRAFIEEHAAERVVMITESTRSQIAAVLAEGQRDGLTTQEIADSISHLLSVTWKSRPETIARTEIAEAQRLSAIDRYTASGLVDRVTIRDGHDDEPCASRNGTTVPLDKAPELGHPNCTLILVPVLREGVI